MKRLLGQFEQTVEACGSSGKNEARRDLLVEASALEVIAEEGKQLIRARLEDVGEHARENCARRAVANAGDFNGAVFLKHRGCGAAMMTLDALGFRNRRAQADS